MYVFVCSCVYSWLASQASYAGAGGGALTEEELMVQAGPPPDGASVVRWSVV